MLKKLVQKLKIVVTLHHSKGLSYVSASEYYFLYRAFNLIKMVFQLILYDMQLKMLALLPP